jgi:hypothetical protein
MGENTKKGLNIESYMGHFYNLLRLHSDNYIIYAFFPFNTNFSGVICMVRSIIRLCKFPDSSISLDE